MRRTRGEQDRVWLQDGNEIGGLLNFSRSDPERTAIAVEAGGRRLELSENQVRSMVFSPALMGELDVHRASAQIGLQDGSLLRFRSMQVETSRIIFNTLGGLQLKSLDAPPQFIDAVRYLVEPEPGVTYLSDLPLASYKNLSETALEWALGVDRDALGRRLQVAGGVIDKGLGMHSSSQAAFRLDGTAARFQAEIVFAQPQRGASTRLGSVQCRVLVAREGKLQTVADTVLQRSSEEESSSIVNVDVTDAQLLVLVVESSDFGQYGDHVLWLDARLVKK